VITGFETLDEVVRASFPPKHTRVVAVRQQGDAAVALFNTKSSGLPYLYEVHYQREQGRWSEGSSGNGAGWHRLNEDLELGVQTLWGMAPDGADKVRGELGGHIVEEGVVDECYLLTWWDVPASDARVTAFRVNGKWVGISEAWRRTSVS
jgi:hypothetical protein